MLLVDRVRSVDDFQGKNTNSWTLSVKTRPEFHLKKKDEKGGNCDCSDWYKEGI